MRKMRRRSRSAISIEQIENRTFLSTNIWGTAPSLINLDKLSESLPSIVGTGQTIALIDTGIDYTHPSLGGAIGPGRKVVGGYDFFDNDSDPLDTDGHGTAVAGVLAADQFEYNGFTYRGIAPAAKLVALRVSQNTTNVPLEKIEAALQWVIENVQEFNIGVVNLSFGYGRFDSSFSDQTLGDELGTLRNLGVMFVSSSGNGGTADGFGITAPASDPTAISVGSVSGSDIISEFSQRSQNLTILAVGEGVRSTAIGGGFTTVDGTSYAAPAVAGTIALLKQIDPTFTINDIRSLLRAAMPHNLDGDQETGVTTGFTFPRLDVKAAVELAQLRMAAPSDVQANVGRSGNENDVAFDTFGVMHFAFYDNDARKMKYATRSPNGNWSAPVVVDTEAPERVGTEFSLKLDSYGRPRLAYLDSPNGDLKFARLDGAKWTVEVLDSNGVAGLYPSLAVDSQDRFWVAYLRKTNWDLRVMYFNGSTWSRETIDTAGQVGYSATIRLDQNERPGIVYGSGTFREVKYAHLNASNTWDISIAEQNILASHMSLAYDVANQPRLSYYAIETADLKYAEYVGNEWRRTLVASRGATGLYTNLQSNGTGSPIIFYWDKRTNSLQKATRDNDVWNITRVAAAAGKFLSVNLSTNSGQFFSVSNRGDRLVFIETL